MIKKYIALIGVAVLLVLPNNIHAKEIIDTYTNSNGVEMSLDDYFNLRKLYSEQYIDVLTQDEYDYRMGLGINFDNVEQVVKYIRTDYNHVTGEITETEITEAEFLALDGPKQGDLPQATVIETESKRVSLGFSKSSSTTAVFSFSAMWKLSPTTRSYDVIAARFANMTKINGTQQGKQIYTLNGVTDYIQYSFDGTNINNQSNGFGISMNLLNADVSYLECTIDSSMDITGYTAWVYATYQHAVNNVSLSTSQDYTLGSGGFGNVVLFNNGVGSNYDGMQGTYSYMIS